MKEGKKINLYIIFGFLIVLLYLFLAIKPLRKELCFEPEKTLVLSELADEQFFLSPAGEKSVFCFRLSDYAGYLTEDAEPVFVSKYPYKATLTDSMWTFYENDADAITVKTVDGTEQAVLNTTGFPFFQNDRLFVFLPNGNALKEFYLTGREKWIYEGYAPITAYNSSKTESVIGFADGEIVCLDSYGKQKFSFYPKGSDREVILGVDIDSDKKMIASVSGINRQRFVLVSYTDDQQKIVFHEYLDGNLRQPIFVHFGKLADSVYFQCKTGLGIMNCSNFKLNIVPMTEQIIQVEELEDLGLSLVLAENDNNWKVYLFENAYKLIGTLPFTAESAFLKATENGFFLGKDNTVSKIKITYK
ncbi:MAG: hypothetical protein J6T84_12450 [Spirochaetaceae bacterium]|nr:hypothetical protein [Spirochaetaceae bacterium]